MRSTTIRSIMVLPLLLLVACSKSPSAPAALAPSGTIPVKVILKITGIAHLVGTTATSRLLVMPNESGAGHTVILLADDSFRPDTTLLPNMPPGGATAHQTSHWRALTGGLQIDPVNSTGWDTAANAPPIQLDETGDCPHAVCPVLGTIPNESLHWLPHMSLISTKPDLKAKATHVMANPSPAHVSARMEISGGSLFAELANNPAKFQFRNKVTKTFNHVQAVATYLDYAFMVNLDSTTPEFTLMGKDFAGRAVTLGKFTAQNRRIEIYLANVVTSEFFNPMPAHALAHFHQYYDSVDGTVADFEAEPMKGENCKDGGVGDDVECGPNRLP